MVGHHQRRYRCSWPSSLSVSVYNLESTQPCCRHRWNSDITGLQAWGTADSNNKLRCFYSTLILLPFVQGTAWITRKGQSREKGPTVSFLFPSCVKLLFSQSGFFFTTCFHTTHATSVSLTGRQRSNSSEEETACKRPRWNDVSGDLPCPFPTKLSDFFFRIYWLI